MLFWVTLYVLGSYITMPFVFPFCMWVDDIPLGEVDDMRLPYFALAPFMYLYTLMRGIERIWHGLVGNDHPEEPRAVVSPQVLILKRENQDLRGLVEHAKTDLRNSSNELVEHERRWTILRSLLGLPQSASFEMICDAITAKDREDAQDIPPNATD